MLDYDEKIHGKQAEVDRLHKSFVLCVLELICNVFIM